MPPGGRLNLLSSLGALVFISSICSSLRLLAVLPFFTNKHVSSTIPSQLRRPISSAFGKQQPGVPSNPQNIQFSPSDSSFGYNRSLIEIQYNLLHE